MQKQSEVLPCLEAKWSSTSQLDAQVSAVDVSSSQLTYSTQLDAPQQLGTHPPAMLSQSGPLRSQTTPTPLTNNVSQLSEAVHRHHFVDRGPLCGEPVNEPPAVVLLESVEELYSQRYMESLVQQEAFSRSPEGQEKLHSDHNLLKTEEYSHMPLEVMEIKPLVKQEFQIEQYVSEMLPTDEIQQEMVQTSSDEECDVGRVHAELSKEKLQVDISRLLQQENIPPSSSNSEQLLDSTLQQSMLPDLSSTFDASGSGERHRLVPSGRQSPEGNVATGFFSEMKSELSHIVALMQVSLCFRMQLSAIFPSPSSPPLFFPSLPPLLSFSLLYLFN